MVRKYVRKTSRGVSYEKLKEAADMVTFGRSINGAAKDKEISRMSLARFCQKLNSLPSGQIPSVGYHPASRVFSDEQEEESEKYLKRASELFFGLTPRDVRKLAFQCAVKREIKFPQQWKANSIAGIEWFRLFMKRHPKLSVRSPQATSLSRGTSFNKYNVNMFFDNLNKCLSLHNFKAQNIYNVDETGITTAQTPDRIVAQKGIKQVGLFTSAERGTLVTLAIAVNAIGNSVPPHFVFPCKIFKDHFIRDGPTGCVGTANGSGWMKEEDFFLFIQHFQKHSGATLQNKVLLLLDNHESHLSVKVIDFCKSSGIILLSFPPHCSHKLQPLDGSVYGPLKTYVNTACDSWIRANPGKTMTIYDIPGIVRSCLSNAATIKNITAGFKCTEIYPFNRNIFSDTDFAPSEVTDRKEATATSHVVTNDTLAATSSLSVSLDIPDIWPFPKAGPRKASRKGRKRRKSTILTETPERNALDLERQNALSKKRKNVTPAKLVFSDKVRNTPKSKRKAQ